MFLTLKLILLIHVQARVQSLKVLGLARVEYVHHLIVFAKWDSTLFSTSTSNSELVQPARIENFYRHAVTMS